MDAGIILFTFAGVVAVASALLMITRRSPVISVLYLIVNFFCLSVLYLTLRAQFIAVIQILVYAGAIMVLFLFVIMLLNLGDEQGLIERKSFKKTAAVVLAAALCAEVLAALVWTAAAPQAGRGAGTPNLGTVESIGQALFTKHLLAFEVTSILLLAAIVGVLVLAKKKFE